MTLEIKSLVERSFTITPSDFYARCALNIAVVLFSLVSFWMAFGSLHGVLSCCDTWVYIEGGQRLFEQGLLTKTSFTGYRSYFNFGLAHILTTFGNQILSLIDFNIVIPSLYDPTVATRLVQYAAGAGVAHLVIATALIWTQCLTPKFLICFAAIYFNPLLVVHVVYALQEGQFFLLAAPLLIVILNYQGGVVSLCALLGIFSGMVVMLKSSFFLMLVPISIFAFVRILRSPQNANKLAVVALIVPLLLLIAPQSARSLAHFQSISPYPDQQYLHKQFAWGVEMWKYDTWFEPGKGWKGRRYKTPFAERANEEGFYQSNLQASALLLVGHTLSSFDYSTLTPYVTLERTPLISIFNIASFTLLFLGIMTSVQLYVRRIAIDSDILIDGLAFASIAALPFIAPETRFGAIPLTMFSIRALQALRLNWSATELSLLGVGLLAFVPSALLAVFFMNATIGAHVGISP